MENIYYRSSQWMLIIRIEDEFISSLSVVQDKTSPISDLGEASALAKVCIEQLDAYFSGRLESFDLPYRYEGTAFQKRVWKLLEKISYGEVRTYGELATDLGGKNYSRAVGAACGKNPLLLIVPCHRVIGENRKLTGFAAGLQLKSRLLEIEASTSFRRLDLHH